MATGSSTRLQRRPVNSNERLANERLWIEQVAASCLPGSDYQEWIALRSTHRFMAFEGKKLLLWRLLNGKPVVEQTYTFLQFVADNEFGAECVLLDASGKEFVVNHAPEKLAQGVYLWMPFYSDVQFIKLPGHSKYTLYFSTMLKMPRNPQLKVEGSLYLSETKAFAAMWPDFYCGVPANV